MAAHALKFEFAGVPTFQVAVRIQTHLPGLQTLGHHAKPEFGQRLLAALRAADRQYYFGIGHDALSPLRRRGAERDSAGFEQRAGVLRPAPSTAAWRMNSHNSSFKDFTDNSRALSIGVTIPTPAGAQRELFLAAAAISASVKSRPRRCRRAQTNFHAPIIKIDREGSRPTIFVSDLGRP
jgi:hypothetical protein